MQFQIFHYTITFKRAYGPLLYITKLRLGVEEQVYPVPCRCYGNQLHPPTDDDQNGLVDPYLLAPCSVCKRKRCGRVDWFSQRFHDGYGDATLSYVCHDHAPWHDMYLDRYRYRGV